MPPAPTRAEPDSALISRVRLGDASALAELWSRHAPIGYRYARRLTSAFDADDLVTEAYLQIMRTMRRGNGPISEFRPYLLTTIRNLARTWGRSRHEIPLETLDDIEAADSAVDARILSTVDARATVQAFRSLPLRWQRVLWLLEVEHLTPAQIAGTMGMTATGVSSLAGRARDGLREAWIQVQVSRQESDRDCAWSRDHIGSYVRRNLSPTHQAKMNRHLTSCPTCAGIVRDALDAAAVLPSPHPARAVTSRTARAAGSS